MYQVWYFTFGFFFFFLFFSQWTHTNRVCLFHVMWEWLKIFSVLFDKRPLPKKRAVVMWAHFLGVLRCAWVRFNGMFLSSDVAWWAQGRSFCVRSRAPVDCGSSQVSVQIRFTACGLVPWWLRYLGWGHPGGSSTHPVVTTWEWTASKSLH